MPRTGIRRGRRRGARDRPDARRASRRPRAPAAPAKGLRTDAQPAPQVRGCRSSGIDRVSPGAPLGLEHRADDLADPFAFEVLVLDELGLSTHAEPIHDPQGGAVPRIAPGRDPVQARLVEPQPQDLPSPLRGEPASLGVRVEAPADLALAALDALQAEHELTDLPPGRGLHRGEDEWVAVRLEVGLAEALIELGPRLVDVHRRPRKVSTDVLAAEHRVEEREVSWLVRSKRQPCGPAREGDPSIRPRYRSPMGRHRPASSEVAPALEVGQDLADHR